MTESFVDFLEAYGASSCPSMVRSAGEDIRHWQQRFGAKVRELLGPVPERVPARASVVESVALADHTRQVLRIPVNRFVCLVAYALVPNGLADGERRPGLLVFHGHDQHGIDSLCGLRGATGEPDANGAPARSAVRAGYVVLTPAWWGWHGRDGHVRLVGNRDKCNVIQMAAAMYGLSVLALHMQDAQAAMDILAARPDVAPDRIGCLGNSYGGRTAMWFTLLDERVRACVAAGCMNTFRERSLKLSSCAIQFPPGLLAFGDVPELFSLIAPRPMQLQAGCEDPLITPSDRDVIERTVRNAYRSFDAEQHLDYVLHHGGHILVWDAAEAFLKRHL